ncbi:hypothetical protein H5410_061324 [Solanum commersonii]|uniref:Uncharacterized protein n=1 Tax=Solanum commersonii TaxID=4109 RepID=A0A9J5W9A3_SOLCO|nr:hypothetical protein H5410_061324 [Solanum commersonii]
MKSYLLSDVRFPSLKKCTRFWRDIRNVMAPAGRVYKKKPLIGQTVSFAQIADESNKCTPAAIAHVI